MKYLYLISIFFSLNVNGQFSDIQTQKIDSLNLIINTGKSKDTSIAKAYFELSEVLYVSNIDTIKYYCNLAIILSEKNLQTVLVENEIKSFKTTIAFCYINMTNYHFIRGDILKALFSVDKSVSIFNEINDQKGLAFAYNNLGVIYRNQGDIEKAISYYYKAINIQIKDKNDLEVAVSYNNLGQLFFQQKLYDKSTELFNKCLTIAKELDNGSMISNVQLSLGYTAFIKGEIPKALKLYNEALETSIKLNDKRIEASVLNNIGYVHKSNENYDLALKYYASSYEIRKNEGFKKGFINSNINIGSVLNELHNYKEAKTYLQEAYSLALEIGYPIEQYQSAKLISEVALNQKNYKEAYTMFNLYIIMRDSVNNTNNQKQLIQQQTKYEYETQKVIDDIKSEKLLAIEKEQQEKQKAIIYSIIVGFCLVVLFLGFVFNRLRKTKKQKIIIEKQKILVEKAHRDTEHQKKIIEETHREMTDSINYAKRLQNAILPAFSDINKHIENNFILFQPKDVVSGDFYWFEYKVINGKLISFIASADCTGHGVPGAMVSVVCSNALNRTVNEFGIIEPAKILDKTRELVIQTFAKSGDDVKDGMDIALCALTQNKVIFAGANNPLWIVRNVERLTATQLNNKSTLINKDLALIEFKGDKQPIGLYVGMKPFSQTEIEIEKGDVLYLFTDGFADQFGGEKGKKFKYKPFKKLLTEISKGKMSIQNETIAKHFEDWRGDLEQVDDICIIGIKPSM